MTSLGTEAPSIKASSGMKTTMFGTGHLTNYPGQSEMESEVADRREIHGRRFGAEYEEVPGCPAALPFTLSLEGSFHGSEALPSRVG